MSTPASNNGLALASSAANILLDSKENDETGHAARLDITLVSQGVPGLIGPVGAAGPVGPAGVNGLPWPQGISGPAGPAGAQGPAGVGLAYQNNYNAGTTYAANDAVTFNGSSYISLQNSNLGRQPDISPAFWELFAAAGATGPAGPIGATGATGPIGPFGPAGPTGPTGPAGPAGPAGTSGGGVNAGVFAMEFVNPGTNAGTTFFMSPLANSSGPNTSNNGSIATSTENNFTVMPAACTMIALNVGVNNYYASSADTTTITVYKNQLATTMACSVNTNGNGANCQDATHTFSVAGGDIISIAFSETNATPFNKVTVELVCQ